MGRGDGQTELEAVTVRKESPSESFASKQKLLQHLSRDFVDQFTGKAHPDLFGKDNGKMIGDYVEKAFKKHLVKRGLLRKDEGNSAHGVDIPSLNLDIKTTRISRPQASAPFKSTKELIEGLPYNMLVFQYEKVDQRKTSRLHIREPQLIPAEYTGDKTTTSQLRELIINHKADADMVFAWLLGKGIEGTPQELKSYAQRLVSDPPKQGRISITDARQWRLRFPTVEASP